MDSTKNFFDAWINTQTQLVGNIMDTSKKIQESLNKNDVVEKSVELYNSWFEKQKTLVDSMVTNLKDKVGKEKANDFLQDWMETQAKLGQKWMGLINNSSSSNNYSPDNFGGYLENMQKMYGEWNKVYGQLFNQVNHPMENPFFAQTNPLKSNFSQLINNTQTYMKMFELWQPIYKITQSNTMGLDALTKMLDMDRYREIMDGIFHFMTPEKSQNFLAQIKRYNEMMVDSMGGAKDFLSDSFNQIQKVLPQGVLDKNLGSLAQLSQQFTEQFNKFINPYFTMIPAGKEKEIADLMIKAQENYAKYFIKASEMQNIVYVTGQQAIEKSVRELMQQAQAKADLISFDEFYTIWVEKMESDMIQLFGSEAFSKLLGELLKIGLELKSTLDKQMEYMLSSLPVVPRSEMDEVNATIYELRNKIRNLEDKLDEINQEKPAKAKVTETNGTTLNSLEKPENQKISPVKKTKTKIVK